MEPLRIAQQSAAAGDWDTVIKQTNQAKSQWESWSPYFHVVLRHNDTDEVEVSFEEVLSYIQNKESGGEYAAANAVLIAKIKLLYEMEQFRLKNLL